MSTLNCPIEIIQMMHEYLEEDISGENEKRLQDHLRECPACEAYMRELKETEMLLFGVPTVKAPEDFVANVVKNLPKEKKRASVQRFFRQHPFFAAAAIFMLLMSSSLFSSWSADKQFSVSTQPNLVVENGIVIVPKGEVIEGDVLVRNGKLKIEGQINGDVLVINGEVINGDDYLASVGHVSGDIEEVNEWFDWLWFKIKNGLKKTGQIFD